MAFTPLDYTILTLYLIATAALGTLLGRGQSSTSDYFLGGKRMPWWAICFSIVATETSTLTFIGVPAIAYTGNLMFLQLAFGYLIGKFLVSFVLIPGYFKGDIQTAYEILTEKFGVHVRRFSAAVFQVTRALADGVRLFATALVLSVVLGMDNDLWPIFIIGIVTIIYTFYGGMTAVVWNDVIQLFVYLIGALVALYLIPQRIPEGWSEIVTIAEANGKFALWNLTFDFTEPYTLLAGMIGGAFLTFATHGTDQMMVQRYLACGNQSKSQLALIASGVVVIVQFFVFLVIGVMLYTFYHHFPLDHELEHVNRIFPLFIVEEMPSGVSGLVIAAVFAAAMSTLSSSLNSLSSSSMNDFYRSWLVPQATEQHYFRVSRFFTLGWGVVLIMVSFMARDWGEVLQVGLTIASLTMGSVLGIFLLGRLPSAPGPKGGLVAMVCGIAAMVAVASLTPLAWTWYVLVGTATTVTGGVIFGKFETTSRQ